MLRYITVSAMVAAIIVAQGCTDDPDLAGADAMRSFSTGSYWDEVCCDYDNPTLCFGHRAGTGAVWSPVYSDCYIDGLVTAGWLVPNQNGWGIRSCDPGGVPTSTPEYECYTMGGTPICFGGEDGWWSVVQPGCQDDGYDLNWFATGSCVTSIYASGYDDKAGKAGVQNKARVWSGDDQFEVRPECYLDNYAMVGMEADACDPPWELQCWDGGSWIACVGEIESTSMMVLAPSDFEASVDNGDYVQVASPVCTLDPYWEDVTCWQSTTYQTVSCMGHKYGVLVPTTDPCAGNPGGPYAEFHGNYVYPDDAANYASYTEIPWPG